MHHYRKTVKKYRQRRKVQECPFCNPETLGKAILETKDSYIVSNLTQYDLWELYDVTDHLLIIPKRHVKSLKELNGNERLDIMSLAADYEEKGYNVYSRGVEAATRSVEHQHTHLIKLAHKRPRFAFYLHKPYFLIKW